MVRLRGVDLVRWAVCTCGHGGPGEEDARRVGREKKIVNVYFPTDVKVVESRTGTLVPCYLFWFCGGP